MVLSRQDRRLACAAAALVAAVVCLALVHGEEVAAPAPSPAVNGATSTRLADECAKLAKLSKSHSRTVHSIARKRCRGRAIKPGMASSWCNQLAASHNSSSVGDTMAEAFKRFRTNLHGDFSLTEDYRRGMCALIKDNNNSLVTACEASRDALAVSPEAFTKMCRASLARAGGSPADLAAWRLSEACEKVAAAPPYLTDIVIHQNCTARFLGFFERTRFLAPDNGTLFRIASEQPRPEPVCDDGNITPGSSTTAKMDALTTTFTSFLSFIDNNSSQPKAPLEGTVDVCQLVEAKRSLKAACEAAHDALSTSSEAFAKLCRESFDTLHPPCDGWYRKDKCLKLFNKGESKYDFLTDSTMETDMGCKRRGLINCAVRVPGYLVTKDCCDQIDNRCLCKLKEEVLASTKSKGVDAPHCFKNLSCK